MIGIAGNSLILPVAPGYKLDPSYEHEPERDSAGQPQTTTAAIPSTSQPTCSRTMRR